jgi:hypothetical protein
MPMPTKKTEAICNEILQRISDGEFLTTITKSKKEMPHQTVWLDWCQADEALAIAYAKARECGENAIAEKAYEIIDEPPLTYKTDGGTRMDAASVAHQRNRVWGRLQMLAKFNPKRWGDKVDLTTDGKAFGTMSEMTDAELHSIASASRVGKS